MRLIIVLFYITSVYAINFLYEDFSSGDFKAHDWQFADEGKWVIEHGTGKQKYFARTLKTNKTYQANMILNFSLDTVGYIIANCSNYGKSNIDSLIFYIDGLPHYRFGHTERFFLDKGDHSIRFKFVKNSNEINNYAVINSIFISTVFPPRINYESEVSFFGAHKVQIWMDPAHVGDSIYYSNKRIPDKKSRMYKTSFTLNESVESIKAIAYRNGVYSSLSEKNIKWPLKTIEPLMGEITKSHIGVRALNDLQNTELLAYMDMSLLLFMTGIVPNMFGYRYCNDGIHTAHIGCGFYFAQVSYGFDTNKNSSFNFDGQLPFNINNLGKLPFEGFCLAYSYRNIAGDNKISLGLGMLWKFN